MKLDSTFAVTAAIDQVWATLMDFEKVAGCLPGAQILNKLSEDAYQVAMKVKLGPVTMQYKGQMEVVERDALGHRAVLKGSAKEARGQGTAQATAALQLEQDGATTRGTVSADLDLSGRAAAMGRGVIGSVTDQMMTQFAQNLQTMLGDGAPSAEPTTTPSTESTTRPSAEPEAARVAAPVSPVPARPAAAAPADSLNALALARATMTDQLRDPRRVLQLLAVVAVLAYKCGQLATRRERARWLGTGADE